MKVIFSFLFSFRQNKGERKAVYTIFNEMDNNGYVGKSVTMDNGNDQNALKKYSVEFSSISQSPFLKKDTNRLKIAKEKEKLDIENSFKTKETKMEENEKRARRRIYNKPDNDNQIINENINYKSELKKVDLKDNSKIHEKKIDIKSSIGKINQDEKLDGVSTMKNLFEKTASSSVNGNKKSTDNTFSMPVIAKNPSPENNLRDNLTSRKSVLKVDIDNEKIEHVPLKTTENEQTECKKIDDFYKSMNFRGVKQECKDEKYVSTKNIELENAPRLRRRIYVDSGVENVWSKVNTKIAQASGEKSPEITNAENEKNVPIRRRSRVKINDNDIGPAKCHTEANCMTTQQADSGKIEGETCKMRRHEIHSGLYDNVCIVKKKENEATSIIDANDTEESDLENYDTESPTKDKFPDMTENQSVQLRKTQNRNRNCNSWAGFINSDENNSSPEKPEIKIEYPKPIDDDKKTLVFI